MTEDLAVISLEVAAKVVWDNENPSLRNSGIDPGVHENRMVPCEQ